MALAFTRNEVSLVGTCGAEEALELMEWLVKRRRPRVKLTDCTHLHSALLATLLAFRPTVSGAPSDPFLANWIVPILSAADGAAQETSVK